MRVFPWLRGCFRSWSNPVVPTLASAGVGGRSPLSFFVSSFPLLCCFFPALHLDLFSSSYLIGISPPHSSKLWSLVILSMGIVHRVLVLQPTRVFPTPPLAYRFWQCCSWFSIGFFFLRGDSFHSVVGYLYFVVVIGELFGVGWWVWQGDGRLFWCGGGGAGPWALVGFLGWPLSFFACLCFTISGTLVC